MGTPRKILMSGLAFVAAFLVATAGYRIGAGEKDNKQRQEDAKVTSPRDKTAGSNGRWFADPRRGWIRSDEREEQRKREENRGEISPGEKAGRVIWDY